MMKKSVISFFLCMSLCVMTAAPVSVFAAEADLAESAPTTPVQESTAPVESQAPLPEEAPSESTESNHEPNPALVETSAKLLSETQTDSVETTAPSSPSESQLPDETAVRPAWEQMQDNTEAMEKQGQEPPVSSRHAQKLNVKSESTEKKAVVSAEKTASGIKVSGGLEGKDWIYDSGSQTLTISKNGMTVSGTATDNLVILCTLAVSTLTLDNLDHGTSTVEIVSGGDESTSADLALTLIGKNKLDAITGSGDITIQGMKNSRLDVTAGITSFHDLNFRNATVTGGLFSADRDVNITGTTQLAARPTSLLKPVLAVGLPVSMITAGRNINIDLAPGGSVTAVGTKTDKAEVLPMLAMGNIYISTNSKVVVPQGGKVGTSDLFDILPVQIIMDSSGQPAFDVEVKHISAQNFTSPSANSTFAVPGTDSPQTGDDSSNVLFALYLILITAGVAVIALCICTSRSHIRAGIMQ